MDCKYKESKSNIEIEEFSGTKLIAIANHNQDKILKSEYQANRSFILSEVLKKIMTIMVRAISGKRMLENLLEKVKNTIKPYL